MRWINITLIAACVAIALYSPAVPAEFSPVKPAIASPHLAIGLQDYRSFVLTPGKPQTTVLKSMVQIGASWTRAIYYPDRRFKLYEDAVKRAAKRNIETWMVIDCSPSTDPATFFKYVTHVVHHFKRWVTTWSICNEPNQEDIAPELLRQLFPIGSSAVRAEEPNAAVLCCELSSGNDPLGYLKEVLCNQGGQCVHWVVDDFSIHIYPATGSLELTTDPLSINYSDLPKLNDMLDTLAKQGVLSHPDGTQLNVRITETGFQTLRASGAQTAEPLPDATRMLLVQQLLSDACSTPHLAAVGFWQVLPAGEGWDTSLIGKSGHPDKTFLAIRDWLDSNQQCTAREPDATVPLPPSAPNASKQTAPST
jgi:hypothetical protein